MVPLKQITESQTLEQLILRFALRHFHVLHVMLLCQQKRLSIANTCLFKNVIRKKKVIKKK